MSECEVCEIRGECPMYKVGDRISVDDSEIVLDKTDALCIHALPTLLHYALALEYGADPVKLELTKPGNKEHAYLQCVDPWKPYGGGTVIFRCRRVS